MASQPAVHREVERKLRVAPDFVPVDLVALGVVARVIPGQPVRMTAAYHDTPDLRLLRWGATLRRREGGADAGWHLKLPVHGADSGTRDELHLPLWSGSAGFVPAELADIVAPLTRGERLVPVAWVHTLRTPSTLIGSMGTAVAELADDHVEVRDPMGQTVAAYREIEVEVIGSGEAAIAAVDQVASVLIGQGAQASSVSKAAAALGERAGAPADIAVGRLPTAQDPAREALRSIIALHSRHLVLADVAVRRGLPDSVHQLRVAARRLRSTLRILEPLLEVDWARTVEEELSWLASELGLVRDTEVLASRLAPHVDALGEPDASLVRAALDPVLRNRLVGAQGSALAALRSDRHDLLLEDLVRGSTEPPTTELAEQPSGIVLPALAEKAWKRLGRAVRELSRDAHGQDAHGQDAHADAWHRVRIRAKRARYVVESIEPVLATPGRRLARRLADVTEVLGELQDARVAGDLIREVSMREGTRPQTAYALGRLSAQQAAQEQSTRRAFGDLWPSVRHAAKQLGWA